MAAFTTTPTEAGEGPSVLGIAAAIGAKIRDAAEQAKEEREKAKEAGEDPKKGSLFKSSLANQFNPIKSKKAKSNWAKQFSWNKPKDKPVTPPTQADGQQGSAKLKEFIAGGFTAILKDTGVMVAKLGGIDDGVSQNLAASNRSAGTLTVIKETLDAQTDLRRKTLEEAKYARAEKKLEQTQDTSSATSVSKSDEKDSGDNKDDGGGGGGPLEWLMNALGIADIASSIPGAGKFLQKLNPFKKSPVTQGGKPPGPRMPGSGPKVTTSGGAAAPKPGGGNWFKKLLPFADDAAKGGAQGGAKLGAKGAGGLLGRLLPGAQTALGIGLAAKSFADGDAVGGLLNLGSALPGPFGWAFLAASLGRDVFAPGLGNKELGQAFSTPGLTPEQTMGMSGLERGLMDISTPSFTGFSQGGIVPLARGGVVDNPTKTTLNPGDSVIPLNRNVGKQMLGDKNQATPGETAVDTVGAMILGVSSGMLGKTESGTAGDAVKQDIRKAAKEFGISNLTFTSSIGKGRFGVVDTNKNAKDFMMSLFKSIKIFGGDTESGGGGGGGNNTPPGADIENTQVKNEVDLAANTHKEVGFTPGQQFGDRGGAHRGSDIGTQGKKGYYVALKKKGKVVNNDYDEVSGNWVGIDVGGGVEYRFMHLAQRSPLKKGQEYNGETIGEIGNTGRSSGEHLHFEKLVNGKHVDPKSDASALLSIGKGLERKFDPKDTAKPPVQTKPTGQDTGTQGSGDQASMPNAQVTQLAQDGMVGPSWMPWNWGKVVDQHRNTKSSDYANQNSFLAKQAKQREMMKELGYQGGGANRRPNYAKYQKAERIKQQKASLAALNSGKGLDLKGAGLGTNIGKGYPAVYKGREAIKVKLPPGGSYEPEVTVGGKRFFAVKQGDSVIYVSNFKAGQKNLGVGTKPPQAPKPKPAPPASPAGGVGPAPSASGGAATQTTLITPPVAPQSNGASTGNTYGGNVPTGKSMAATFADFLYVDLIE